MDFMITAEMVIRRRNVSDLKTGDAVETVGFWTTGKKGRQNIQRKQLNADINFHWTNKHSLIILQDHTWLENDVRGATCH
jgi:hypothetical protein